MPETCLRGLFPDRFCLRQFAKSCRLGRQPRGGIRLGAIVASPLFPLGLSRVCFLGPGLLASGRCAFAVPKQEAQEAQEVLGASRHGNTQKGRICNEAAARLVDFVLLLALDVLACGTPHGPPAGRQVFCACSPGKAEKPVANVPAAGPYERESGTRRSFFGLSTALECRAGALENNVFRGAFRFVSRSLGSTSG